MKNFLAFRAFFVLVCILEACTCIEDRPIVDRVNNTAFVVTASELLDALGAAHVEKIMLLGK